MSVFYNLSPDHYELLIHVHGRFDYALQSDFRDSYDDIEPHPKNCVVNLEHTTHLEGSALGILLSLREKLGKTTKIKIINSRPEVKRVLQVALFDRLFEIV